MRDSLSPPARDTRRIAALRRAPAFAKAPAFARAEHGSIIVLSIFFLTLMLMIGGIAVDVMRHESTRSRMQGTLDRAVLAAANLSQTKEPDAVVTDYVTKAGMAEYLTGTTVTDNTLNARGVTATAEALIPSFFMQMSGVDSLNATALSAAEEKVTNVEVSLVLDISNSMNDNGRIGNLRTAAKDFVDIVLKGANTGAEGAPVISISIVPYTGQVNIGQDLWNTYPNAQYGQSYSYCVDFPASDYSVTTLANSTALVGSGNSEPFASTRDPMTPTFYWCPEPDGSADPRVTAFSDDPEALKAAIDALRPDGSTAIDIGMKWGVTLLDPSTQPSVSALVANGKVSGAFDGRPFAYDEANTMKVIVLMTDGEHVNDEPRLANAVKTGPSDLWLSGSDTDTTRNWSLLLSDGKYYWSRTGTKTNTEPDKTAGNTSCTTQSVCTSWSYWGSCRSWEEKQQCSNTNYSSVATRLSYPELWHRARVGWVASSLYSAAGISGKYNSWVSKLGPSEKNTRTKSVCDAARGRGITVFSVAFEAPSTGQSLLKYCATTSGHYFDVRGLEIRTAFRSIASHISQLRLTQ
ncbi:MAG: pilus assembly protein TadG-related protein [Cereibacter changlensis]